MWFECEQPFLSGERCVTSRKTAAKETSKSRHNVSLWLISKLTVKRTVFACLFVFFFL